MTTVLRDNSAQNALLASTCDNTNMSMTRPAPVGDVLNRMYRKTDETI